MMRPALYVVLGVLLAPAIAAASPVLSIDGPPAYTPGASFDLTVALTGAESLALYTIELSLSAPAGSAGVDYAFAAAAEPAERYVFDGQGSDGFAYAILNDSQYRITLSDLLIAGSVATVEGVNDLIARVTVSTTTSMSGDLTVAVVAGSLELDTAGAGGVIDGFDQIASNPPAQTIPVPEPASLMMLLAMATYGLRRRRRLS